MYVLFILHFHCKISIKTLNKNITLSNKTLDLLQRNFSFKWQKVANKYLGTHISRDLTKLQELNYLPIIQNIIKMLQKYDRTFFFSWMGRINIVKMDILPKVLYIFQTIPTFFSTNLLDQLRKAVGRFIWSHKSPRIRRDILIRAKKNGGLAFPSFAIYLRSVFMSRIVD